MVQTFSATYCRFALVSGPGGRARWPALFMTSVLKLSLLLLGLCAQAYGQIPAKNPAKVPTKTQSRISTAVPLASAATVLPMQGAAVEPLPTAQQISMLTDTQLTALSVHWQRLAPEQRRALLKTVRARMVNQSNRLRKERSRTIQLQAQRRFGRVVRKNDELVSVETRVLRRRSDGTGTVTSRVMTFGAGFEQRQSRPNGEPAVAGNQALPSIQSTAEPLRLQAEPQGLQNTPLPPTSKVRAATGSPRPGR